MRTNDEPPIKQRRLLIGIICLSVALVVLAIVLGRHWAETGTFGTVEIILTFVMGLLAHLLATWLYHLLFGSDIPRTLQEQIRSIERTCDAVYRGGLWVESERLRLDKHYYDGLINSAERVTVLGIANKGFMTNLVKEFPDNPDNGEIFDLDYVLNQPLFQRLRPEDNLKRREENLTSLHVTVIFLSPESTAAANRAAESQNSETVRHLNKVIQTLTKLERAFDADNEASKTRPKSSKGRRERWSLKGRIEFRSLDEIPENSISLFQDTYKSDRTVMVVGLLPKDLSGEKCPSIIIHRNREHMRLVDSFEERLKQIRNRSSLVLEWDCDGPRLEAKRMVG